MALYGLNGRFRRHFIKLSQMRTEHDLLAAQKVNAVLNAFDWD